MNKKYCANSNCEEEILDEYYFIGDNNVSRIACDFCDNIFCSKECILDFIMVDNDYIENYNKYNSYD